LPSRRARPEIPYWRSNRELALAVGRHRRDRRALVERQLLALALAVDRPAGGDEDDPVALRRARRPEHVGGAADVDRGVEGRVLERLADVDLGGQVEDGLGPTLGGQRAQRRGVADVELDQLGARRQRPLEVDQASGREVVDDRHLVPARQQSVDQIRADKSRAAGDQASHCGADPMGIGWVQARDRLRAAWEG
jgi:hypothetical protein